mgnify:CR=1 FL=1
MKLLWIKYAQHQIALMNAETQRIYAIVRAIRKRSGSIHYRIEGYGAHKHFLPDADTTYLSLSPCNSAAVGLAEILEGRKIISLQDNILQNFEALTQARKPAKRSPLKWHLIVDKDSSLR